MGTKHIKAPDGFKGCQGPCGKILPKTTEFFNYAVPRKQFQAKCKECMKVYREVHKEKIARSKSLCNYKISKEEYNKLYSESNGLCDICGKPPIPGSRFTRLCIDHCHATNKIRGLLCSTCNLVLGKVKDDVSVLEKAISYLNKHGKDTTNS